MPSLYVHIGTCVTFAAVIALAVASIIVSRRNEGQHHRSPDALWDELRKAHGLSWREAGLLRSTAEEAALDPAASIFVDPEVLAHSAGRDTEQVRSLASRLYS